MPYSRLHLSVASRRLMAACALAHFTARKNLNEGIEVMSFLAHSRITVITHLRRHSQLYIHIPPCQQAYPGCSCKRTNQNFSSSVNVPFSTSGNSYPSFEKCSNTSSYCFC